MGGDFRRSAWEYTCMKLYEVTVSVRTDNGTEREVWEVSALSEEEARRIASSRLVGVGVGQIVAVKDTLFRS